MLLLVELLLLLDSWVGLLFDVLLLVEGSALVCAPGAVPFCLIWGLIGGTVLFPVLELPPTMPTEPGGGWTFKRMERGVKKRILGPFSRCFGGRNGRAIGSNLNPQVPQNGTCTAHQRTVFIGFFYKESQNFEGAMHPF